MNVLPSKSNLFLDFDSLTISSHSPSSSFDDRPTVIDTFAPKPLRDLSPTPSPTPMTGVSPSSSASSDFESYLSSPSRFSYEAFVTTRSRVVRVCGVTVCCSLFDAFCHQLYNLPRLAESFLSALFLPQSNLRGQHPEPISLWTTSEEYPGCRPDSIWAVFKTHEEAVSALSLSGPTMSVTTALESDLEPFHKLRRFVLNPPPPPPTRLSAPNLPRLRVSPSCSDLRASRLPFDHSPKMSAGDYTLSTNPPNPRTSFRLGDWICNSPKCAAHNFGRNLTCIGCGCPRSNAGTTSGGPQQQQQQPYPTTRTLSSPRFASYSAPSNPLPNPSAQPALPPQQPIYSSYNQPPKSLPRQQQQHVYQSSMQAPPVKSVHPLLTPSGRAFAVGGKVQNISTDPLNPCIMYWPDNEPFPEQGQIRPSNLVGVPQPPILNTGNRGPIAHQPGDWVCLKCNYLNWRRRKVCQTCLPYAEGNGDSISAAVQAERIALLTSVLAQTQAQAAAPHAQLQAPRSHSLTPPQQRYAFDDVSPLQPPMQVHHAPAHRSQSQYELRAQYNRESSPIYQTSGNRQRLQPSPLYSTGPDFHSLPVHAPAPLLPSFLQDMVKSPSLSPTSSSSADLSLDEYDEVPTKVAFPRAHNADDAVNDLPISNIWRLDGEESKSLSAFALPNRQDLIGSGKKITREVPRLQAITS
ncbi:hypothetical protein H2248_002587 [Termitomyces sp. 'cryptogamus']|nr:hypothetical protein H2248_002587 [Termitomyces sp. 'cryptogamus']